MRTAVPPMTRHANKHEVALINKAWSIPRLPHDQMLAASYAICEAVDARRGVPCEKPRVQRGRITEEEIQLCIKLFHRGLTYVEIGREVGVGRMTAARVISQRLCKPESANA